MAKRDSVVIVGGGAAGMMAALSVRRHRPEFQVILAEHQESLGRKLLVCGAGRCNVTNAKVEPSRFSGASKAFVASSLSRFGGESVQAFFEELGVPLYEEKKSDKGKIFPITNQAQTVLSLLIDEMERAGVEIRRGVHVESVSRADDGFTLKTSKGPLSASRLILASGGKSYPKLGGDGAGYAVAKSFGHTIIEPVPTALPLTAPNPISKKVHGVRAELEIAALIDGKEICRDSDQMMFAKYGFTGPAVLNVSRPISLRLNREKKNDCALEIKFLPGKTLQEIREALGVRWSKRPRQKLSLSLSGLMQNKLPPAILEHLGIKDAPSEDVPSKDKERLTQFLNAWRVPVESTLGWDEAEFTAGGVNCSEVEPESLQSKLAPGLYFAGEILDVDGEVGGFNLTWAWSSGFNAGRLA